MFAPDFGPRSSSSEDDGQVKLRPRATSSLRVNNSLSGLPAPKDRAMPSFSGAAIQRLLAFEVRLKRGVWVLLLGLRLYAAARCQP